MNAIQPSIPPLQPEPQRRENTPRPSSPQDLRRQSSRRKNLKHRQQRHPSRALVLENTAKLFAYGAISALTVCSLVQLLPYLWSQQQKWQEIDTEVKQAEGRVKHLRQDFSRYFDPRQTPTLMKEQSNLVEPGQRQVFLQNKTK